MNMSDRSEEASRKRIPPVTYNKVFHKVIERINKLPIKYNYPEPHIYDRIFQEVKADLCKGKDAKREGQ